MTPRDGSELFIVATVVVGVVWDVIAYRRGGGDATVSTVVREKSQRYPIIAVAVGVAVGHWFWPF